MTNRSDFIEQNINLVYVVIREYYPFLVSDEDIIQCGMVGLCKAAKKWEQKGKFSSFARKIILDEVRTELKQRQKRAVEISLERLMESDKDDD